MPGQERRRIGRPTKDLLKATYKLEPRCVTALREWARSIGKTQSELINGLIVKALKLK